MTTRTKISACAAMAVLLLASAHPSVAAGPHGGGGAPGNAGHSAVPHGSDAGVANSNGPTSPDRDKGLDRAEDRRSAQGAKNSNSPNSSDRDKGLDRAEDRRSAQGAKTR